MPVRVEFYGIPRLRAGAAETLVVIEGDQIALGDVLQELAHHFPGLAGECIEGRQLRHGYAANVDGQRFVNDPDTLLSPDHCLLIMSADAGG